jgi:putative protease
MDEESIRKQLIKLGGTDFEAGEVNVYIDDDGSGNGIFVAVSELNELRRNLVKLLEEQIKKSGSGFKQTQEYKVQGLDDYDFYSRRKKQKNGLCVLVSTAEQLGAVLDKADGGSVKRVYVDSNVFLSFSEPLLSRLKECKTKGTISEVFAALPYITRTEDFDRVKEIADIIKKVRDEGFDGVLVRNLEQLGYLENTGYSGSVILDYGVYTWNSEAALEMIDLSDQGRGFMIEELTAPYELNYHEAADMVKALKKRADIPVNYNIYGHMPMMVSAGCISKTTDKCSGRVHELYSFNTRIYDRMDNEIPVTCNCRSCYNVIWNVYPTSLHKKLDRILKEELFDNFRLDFTIEDRARTGEVLEYYMDRFTGRQGRDIFEKSGYTTGYFKRGVE